MEKDKLKIKLDDGTSILNIEYLDKDREKIIPILTKISTEYQKYSSNKKEKELN